MVKPVVRDAIRADQQLETEHPACETLQGKRGHSLARLRLLSPDAFRDSEQKRPGSSGRVENGYTRIAQALGTKIVAQGAIERADDVAHHLDRRVIDAEFLPSVGIEVARKYS